MASTIMNAYPANVFLCCRYNKYKFVFWQGGVCTRSYFVYLPHSKYVFSSVCQLFLWWISMTLNESSGQKCCWGGSTRNIQYLFPAFCINQMPESNPKNRGHMPKQILNYIKKLQVVQIPLQMLCLSFVFSLTK